MALVCRHWWSKALWLLWPAWVWFAVMATGNHFWLDIARRASSSRCARGGRHLPAPRSAAPASAARQRPDAAARGASRPTLHGRRTAARVALDDGPRADARDAVDADGRGRLALRGRVGARLLRVPERVALLLGRRARLRARLDPGHPRRRPRARGREGDAVRRVPRLDDRPDRRGVHARRDRAGLRPRRQRDRARASRSRRWPARSSSATRARRPRRSA